MSNKDLKLGLFDVVSLVIGSIIGADIYIASAFGADLLGPASLIVWLVAGLIAMTIAINFSYCALISPDVGGPYAYARDVKGNFFGFIVGWSLFLAEWASIAVFPAAFTQYFMFLYPNLTVIDQAILKGIFILIIMITNLIGVKAAGKANDILTIGKLGPLFIFVVFGIFYIITNPTTLGNLQPFFQGDIINFGQALVLIFWAYAGFEISTIPAGEIEKPHKTIPKAIMIGMTIVILFYIISNFVVLAVVPESILKSSVAPLDSAAQIIFNYSPLVMTIGVFMIWLGALISITGSNESGMIGTSRLAYALSIDGLFPKFFSKIHPKYKTPYLSVIVISLSAYVFSLIGGMSFLINASVFFMSFVYLITSAVVIPLSNRKPEIKSKLKGRRIMPVLGVLFSLFILSQTSIDSILSAIILLLVGIPIYIYFIPKTERSELKKEFLSKYAIHKRSFEHTEVFLGHFVKTLVNLKRKESEKFHWEKYLKRKEAENKK